jgi:fructose-bisphosphate aldolase, class I
MIATGIDSENQEPPKIVASKTLEIFKRVVPDEVPGIVFLSGGLSPEEATENLYEMNAIGGQPWELSFSFGRALQNEALKSWLGDNNNNPAAQNALYHRARLVSFARSGKSGA